MNLTDHPLANPVLGVSTEANGLFRTSLLQGGYGQPAPFALPSLGPYAIYALLVPANASFFSAGAAGCKSLSGQIIGAGEFAAIFVGSEVTAFAVADRTSGSTLVTTEPEVSVTAFAATPAEGATITGYLITETAVAPTENWLPDPPATYTITGAEGAVTLYAWAKDSSGKIGSESTTIQFSTAAPVVSNVVVTDNANSTATATWTTDIRAQGSARFGPVSVAGTMPNTTPLEGVLDMAHSVTFAIEAGKNYKIALVNNETESSPFYWPSPWPIPCDINGDCKVNILDLIFVRNKLNQPISGDSILADVNQPAPDGKINILDLIAVRNKLNTQCP